MAQDQPRGAGSPSPGGPPQPPAAGPPGAQPPPAYPQAYGHPYPQPYGAYGPGAYAPAAPGNGLGVAGGVLGIIGLVLAFIPFLDYIGAVLAILAIIFGAIGVHRANERGGTGRGMSITGIVCGIIALVIGVAFIILIYAALRGASSAAVSIPSST